MPVAPPDFRLYHGNDLAVLAGVLAAQLAQPVAGRPLLAPDTILIPQPAMRRWLQKTLAETHGIAANLRFLAPGQFVAQALDANVPGHGASVGDAAALRWRLWAVLADPALLAMPVFQPLHAALSGGDQALAAWHLAGEASAAFEKYQAWRRDWILRWDRGADPGDWQAELWRRATRGLEHRSQRIGRYLHRFAGVADEQPRGLPARVFAFACQNVSPDVLRVIASSARAGTLHFFYLSPVAGWWGDLQTARERLRQDPGGVFADEENPLLRANGAAGRDFIRTLFDDEVVQPDFELPLYVPPDPKLRTGLLHRLQRDLLARRPAPLAGAQGLPSFGTGIADDGTSDLSLQVHSCHTRLREVQVLHDRLRQLLEADPTLQPRDIAVLTPDIDQYAAHVHGVFGAATQPSTIPYALSDTSTLASQPLAQAFLRLLALPSSRFTANEVLELLALPAIAARLQLEAADFALLGGWLRAAGARWGLDAAHRERLEAPAEDAYTWAWALDRLLLGHASGGREDIAGVAPWPDLEGSALSSLDGLLRGLQHLARLQRTLATARDAGHWQAVLAQALDDLFGERPADPGDRRTLDALRALVAALGEEAAAAGVTRALPLDLVQAWFGQSLAEAEPRQPFLTGGVTFGRMVPMRLVPFKVICLLGMNDGQFPRRDPAGGLNRLGALLSSEQRQLGDRSIRDDDRALFLQLFAAATQAFSISYLGRDPRSGEQLPPSVVVAELLDHAARYFADSDHARRQLTIEHPLQPFAAEAFGLGDARRSSYHAGWRAARADQAPTTATMPPFFPATPPWPTAVLPARISRAALLRALGNPSREFLRERVGLRLPEAHEQLPDSEPFDRGDGLHRHALTGRVFQAASAAPRLDLVELARRLLAEGLVAPGAAGVQDIEARLDELAPALAAWRALGHDPAQALAYELDLGDSLLTGSLAGVHASGLRQFSASRGHGKALLGLGLDALVWSALGETRPIHRLLPGSPPLTLQALAPAVALAKLRELLQVFAAVRSGVEPFMPKAGFAWFTRQGTASAWPSARRAWHTRAAGGEGDDAWVRLALRGRDPFDSGDAAAQQRFADISLQVFSGLPGADAASAGDGDD